MQYLLVVSKIKIKYLPIWIGSWIIEGSVCQCVPSGKTFGWISRRTDNFPWLSKAQTTFSPTAICFKCAPDGGSTFCHDSPAKVFFMVTVVDNAWLKYSHKIILPVGLALDIPNLQYEEPFFPIAHTWLLGPTEMLNKGWSLGMCSHETP